MNYKFPTSLVIYLLLHHGIKCVSSNSNLTGSSSVENENNPDNGSESSDPSDTTKPENVKMTPIMLDIEVKKSGDNFDFFKDDKTNVATYTAKANYGFSKVFQKKSGWNFLGSDKVLWQSSTESQYATKVELESDNKATVHLHDGTVKKFEKTGSFGSKKWTEMKSEENKSSGFLEIFTEGSSEPNDSSKYDYNEGESGNKKEYTFKNGSKCTEIKVKTKSVWKFDPNNADKGYPKSIKVWQENYVLIDFEEGNITCCKDQSGDWKINNCFMNSKKREQEQSGS